LIHRGFAAGEENIHDLAFAAGEFGGVVHRRDRIGLCVTFLTQEAGPARTFALLF
jgi:hypothetical protein